MDRPQTGSKILEGKECAGACRHGTAYHQAKWFDKLTNDYKYACCRVDCPCMEYVEPKKSDEEELITTGF